MQLLILYLGQTPIINMMHACMQDERASYNVIITGALLIWDSIGI